MSYFIYPQGTPIHTYPLEARMDGPTSPPYLAAGLTIEWRDDGAIVKTVTTDGTSRYYINTGAADDVNFSATDSGSVIDFVVDGSVFSNPVVLGNSAPVLSSVYLNADAYGRVPRAPSVFWTYTDPDGDPQWAFEVTLGTTAGGNDVYDSGVVLGSATSLALPTLAYGQFFYWTVSVTDGQKQDPMDPELPSTPRVYVSVSGSATVNTPPVASDIQVDGMSGGASIMDKTPVISWAYSDIDGQPQQAFRIMVAKDSGFYNVLWDTGVVNNPNSPTTSVRYGFDNRSSPIPSHQSIYVSVVVYDTLDPSSPAFDTFRIDFRPRVILCTVDNQVNPMDVKGPNPTFTWTYSDGDGDPLAVYDLRVADSQMDWGTDSFVGDIWQPGPTVSPQAYQAVFDFDGTAFGGYVMSNSLQHDVIYYFQLQITDSTGAKSDWYTGFFRLNNPPLALDLAIIPAQPYKSDDLTAVYTFFSDSGNIESPLTEIRWYANGQESILLRNSKTVDSSQTSPNDVWFFTVRPNDGVEYGEVYTSPIVTVVNRLPQATVYGIVPSEPKSGNALTASFATSDPDNDPVTVSLFWYQNGAEQTSLRNSQTVPSGLVAAGDQWYFTLVPNDGWDDGPLVQSPAVIVGRTAPVVKALLVDGMISPTQLTDYNPTISWVYASQDGNPQTAYEVIIGTQPVKVQRPNSTTSGSVFGAGAGDGVIAVVRSDSPLVSGDEITDTGAVPSGASSYQYSTPDFASSAFLGPVNVSQYFNYGLAADLVTMSLLTGKQSGDVAFTYGGATGTYQVEIEYVLEARYSSYKLVVGSSLVDEFKGDVGSGTQTRAFKPTKIATGAKVVVIGTALEAGASASFRSLNLTPLSIFSVQASSMKLSGYSPQDDGSIKLIGLAGTATTQFAYASGVYDITINYLTESAGNPTVTMSIGASTIFNFVFESGLKSRSRVAKGISVNAGDVVKIIGTKNGNASARVQSLVFRPQAAMAGAQLQPGLGYYASVRVFDGLNWSDWYSTLFFTEGSAWAALVSNTVGWTIEARFALSTLPVPAVPTPPGDTLSVVPFPGGSADF